MKYLLFILTAPLTIFSLLFAASNTGDVTISLPPVIEDVSLPLSVLGLGLLALGFICGGLFVWLTYQPLRWSYWKEKSKGKRLEKELNNAVPASTAQQITHS